MALEDPLSTCVRELGQDITFVYAACSRGRRCGLFTPKILYGQIREADKVAFPYGYTFTSDRDIICSCYGVAHTNVGMATASIRTMLQWLLKHAQPFSAASTLVDMKGLPLTSSPFRRFPL